MWVFLLFVLIFIFKKFIIIEITKIKKGETILNDIFVKWTFKQNAVIIEHEKFSYF